MNPRTISGISRLIAPLLVWIAPQVYGTVDVPRMDDPFAWQLVPDRPLDMASAPAATGLSEECIIVVSAGSLPGAPQAIHILDLADDSPGWKLADTAPPRAVSAKAAQSAEHGVICTAEAEPFKGIESFIQIEYNREGGRVHFNLLPAMPDSLNSIEAAVDGAVLYVFGQTTGSRADAKGSFRFYSYRLDGDTNPVEAEWAELPLPDFELPRIDSVVPQYNGLNTSLYLIHATGSISAYDVKTGEWRQFPHQTLSEFRTVEATAVGTATIFILTDSPRGDHPKFSIYNTITDRWAVSDRLPVPAPPLSLFSDSTRSWIPFLDGNDLKLFRGELQNDKTTLSGLDYGVLVGYFGLLIAIGFFFSKRENSTLAYFKAGKRIPGWAMGISLTVTSTSAISFISLPAKAFVTDWLWFATTLFTFVGALLVYFYFLPFFTRLDVTTAYEYLEKRFNARIRVLGGVLFLGSEIFRMGTVTYMPALALSVVTGTDLYLCIILIGIVATIYTLLGGIEAVIWTDVLQTAIMLAGLFCMIGIVFYRIDATVFEAVGKAWDLGKLRTFDFSFDLTVVTIWVVFTTLPVAANPYITNQAFFQRLVTTPNPQETGKGLIVKSVIGPIIIFLLFVTGTCLFLFYYYSPEQFNPVLSKPDQILPWFIVVELPVGISGLMIGAIFAAAMSSLDSGINSICTVFVNDFYVRFSKAPDDAKALKLAKILTLLMGILGTAIAILIASAGIKTMIDVYYQYLIIFMGSVGGIYMLGFFTTRGNSVGAFIGFLVAAVVLWSVKTHTGLIFFTYGLIATSVGLIVGYLASLCFKGDGKSIDGLTFFTNKDAGM